MPAVAGIAGIAALTSVATLTSVAVLLRPTPVRPLVLGRVAA